MRVHIVVPKMSSYKCSLRSVQIINLSSFLLHVMVLYTRDEDTLSEKMLGASHIRVAERRHKLSSRGMRLILFGCWR